VLEFLGDQEQVVRDPENNFSNSTTAFCNENFTSSSVVHALTLRKCYGHGGLGDCHICQELKMVNVEFFE